MKYLKQFLIIMLISFLGEVLKSMLPLPIPASIYGLVLMFLALFTRVLKVEQVEETSDFLIEIMPITFIPPAVGLLDSWSSLQSILVPVIIITISTTLLVMIISGHVTQFIVNHDKKVKQGE